MHAYAIICQPTSLNIITSQRQLQQFEVRWGGGGGGRYEHAHVIIAPILLGVRGPPTEILGGQSCTPRAHPLPPPLQVSVARQCITVTFKGLLLHTLWWRLSHDQINLLRVRVTMSRTNDKSTPYKWSNWITENWWWEYKMIKVIGYRMKNVLQHYSHMYKNGLVLFLLFYQSEHYVCQQEAHHGVNNEGKHIPPQCWHGVAVAQLGKLREPIYHTNWPAGTIRYTNYTQAGINVAGSILS